MLNGKKTYLIAAGFTAYALIGLWMGKIDGITTVELVMQAGLGATIRHGIGHSHDS
jgi:hypothetical protein